MTPVGERYRALIAAGELQPDADQARAVAVLDALAAELHELPQKGSIVWRIIGHRAKPPGGCYLWGGVGRGKSMLMDLAFETIDHPPKRRVHFHEFMLEVHERLRAERRERGGRPDPAGGEGDRRRGARCSASTRW